MKHYNSKIISLIWIALHNYLEHPFSFWVLALPFVTSQQALDSFAAIFWDVTQRSQKTAAKETKQAHAAAFPPLCACWNTEYLVLYGVLLVGNRCLAIGASFC